MVRRALFLGNVAVSRVVRVSLLLHLSCISCRRYQATLGLKRGISIEHWQALLIFVTNPSDIRDALHGSTGRGREGKPSPFSGLVSCISRGWSGLKEWDISCNDECDLIDAIGRRLVPAECFDFFVYGAALHVYIHQEQHNGRVSISSVVDALKAANFSAGTQAGAGGRPPTFSIASQDVISLLGGDLDDRASISGTASVSSASSGATCAIDVALANMACARENMTRTSPLRRFLSLVPPEWPTPASTVTVIDGFMSGSRRGLLWTGPSQTYLRHQLESLASLMGVCMSHTHSYVPRKCGSCNDIFRCHRRRSPKVRVCVYELC